jgi:hypothetical protein
MIQMMSKEKKYKPKIQTAIFSDTSAAVDADSHRSWLVGSMGCLSNRQE